MPRDPIKTVFLISNMYFNRAPERSIKIIISFSR